MYSLLVFGVRYKFSALMYRASFSSNATANIINIFTKPRLSYTKNHSVYDLVLKIIHIFKE